MTSVAQCAQEVENEMRQMLAVWLNGMTPLNSYFIGGERARIAFTEWFLFPFYFRCFQFLLNFLSFIRLLLLRRHHFDLIRWMPDFRQCIARIATQQQPPLLIISVFESRFNWLPWAICIFGSTIIQFFQFVEFLLIFLFFFSLLLNCDFRCWCHSRWSHLVKWHCNWALPVATIWIVRIRLNKVNARWPVYANANHITRNSMIPVAFKVSSEFRKIFLSSLFKIWKCSRLA